MDSVAQHALHRMRVSSHEEHSISRATLQRIWTFARPHHRKLALFLLISSISAGIGVATPLLAGRVIDEIIGHGRESRVIWLAVLIAGLALADSTLGIVERWMSVTIGEGLIRDLRTAVFDHVQRMPIAFFTRTRTGALVSRLNNDVIGAQRAFSDTLSGVVSNFVMLLLTLAVMLKLSWQITLLALVLLPVFVLPARRLGPRMAALRLESTNLNASMSTRMTERFSAPGATLVKLYGRPDIESVEFAGRVDRV